MKNWWGYKEEAAGGMLSLETMMALFSAQNFRERLAPDYLLRARELALDFIEHAKQVTGNNPFWLRKPQ